MAAGLPWWSLNSHVARGETTFKRALLKFPTKGLLAKLNCLLPISYWPTNRKQRVALINGTLVIYLKC